MQAICYIEPDLAREDPDDDAHENYATSIHTCGWNGSLALYRREPETAPPVKPPPEFKALVERVRAEVHARRSPAAAAWAQMPEATRQLLVMFATDREKPENVRYMRWEAFTQSEQASMAAFARQLRADLRGVGAL